MDNFSVFNYDNLSNGKKDEFNKALALKLSSLLDEIKNDDVIGSQNVEEFVISSGSCANAATIIPSLYSSITGGIQAGSGNQDLFNSVLKAFVDAWNDVMKK